MTKNTASGFISQPICQSIVYGLAIALLSKPLEMGLFYPENVPANYYIKKIKFCCF